MFMTGTDTSLNHLALSIRLFAQVTRSRHAPFGPSTGTSTWSLRRAEGAFGSAVMSQQAVIFQLNSRSGAGFMLEHQIAACFTCVPKPVVCCSNLAWRLHQVDS